MKIVIFGKGNMGAPLATLFETAGHDVIALSSQDSPFAALENADIAVFATKYEQALSLAHDPKVIAALAGKIVIDVTNPLAPDFMSLTVGHETSAGEEIARLLPGAKVVKAFNTVFADVLAKRAGGEVVGVPAYVSGDDADAVDVVLGLAEEIGFEAYKAGPLSNARYMEPMAELMVQFGYGLGHGAEIGFAIVR